MAQMLSELFISQARRHPEAPAVISDEGVLTYRELEHRAGQIANALRDRSVGTESVVGILMQPSPDLVATLMGVWLAGGCYLPLDSLHPAERLRRVTALSGARTVLADPRWSSQDLGLEPGVNLCHLADLDCDGQSGRPPVTGATPRNAAYMIFTSGSTGEPKGVVVEHGGIANRVLWAVRTLRLTAADRLLHKTPLTFDAAQWEIFAPLACGAPVTLAGRDAGRDVASLSHAIRAQRATVVQVVPSMLRLLAAEPALATCHSLRAISAGGESLRAELCHQVISQVDVEVWNTYGPTECTIDVTAARFDRAQAVGPVAIGEPIDNNWYRLLTSSGDDAERGAVAELYACGVGVSRGYHGNPALTAERFLPDETGGPGARMYRTGDLVRERLDGGLEFVGRIDAQMKINGVRIEPGEVEAALLAYPQVVDAAVRAATDPDGIDRLVAYVVTAGAGSIDELPAFLRDRLPPSMVPTAFTELAALPRTTSGKTDRSRLPEPDWTGSRQGWVAAVPENARQRIVLMVWRQLLGVDEVGLDEDFFRVGGHSLMMTRLAPRLTEVSGLQLDLRELYQAMTVRKQAELLDRAMAAQPIPRLPDGARIPLSHAQERFWLLDLMNPGSPEYLLPMVVRLPAGASVGNVRRAVCRIAARHDALRSRYPLDATGPYVIVDPPRDVALRVVDIPKGGVAEVLAKEFANGFDLQTGPLWRAVLLREPDAEQRLVIVCHHIVSDGWSVGVLDREIRELVAAEIEDREPRLPRLPVRYADIAAWQRSQMTDELMARQLDYWRETLTGLPPFDLTTRARAARRSITGSAITFDMADETAAALLATGRRAGATPFMTLLTLWTTMLARVSGQWDFGVGTPSAGRGRPESHHLVGPLLNTVVIRPRLTPELSFAEALVDVQRACRAGFSNQAVPFEAVVDAVEPNRDQSRTPLFQVLFTLVEGLLGERSHDDDVDLLAGTWSVARTDLTLTMWPYEDGRFGGALEFASAIFDPSEMDELVGGLKRLADICAVDPDLPLGEINLKVPPTSTDPVSLTSPHQETIRQLFSELLGREQVGADENFFTLGGTSLQAARLLWGLQNAFAIEVPMRAVFDHPTPIGVARVVEDLVRAEIDDSRGTGAGPQEEDVR